MGAASIDLVVQWAVLGIAAFLAGIVDAVIGGGGMVQLPALFAAFPGVAPAALFGTNKFASAIGTTGAALRYSNALAVDWKIATPAILAAFVASLLGAYAVTFVPAEPLRKALPFILLGLLIYTLRSNIGLEHAPHRTQQEAIVIAASGSSVIGFYDGFFGAGTGAFYKLLFVRGLGFDFLNAAAPAKFTNVASNLAAVVVFAASGQLFWGLGLWMAAANFAGGQAGSLAALKFGSGFIRRAFIAVVSLLIAKTFYDAYLQ